MKQPAKSPAQSLVPGRALTFANVAEGAEGLVISDLARAIAAEGDGHGTWITAIDDPCLPIYYATVNLWAYLGQGLDKSWVTISNTAQTGDTEDFLRAGRAIGAAIARTDRRVILLASGALSHTFWPLRELRAHEASDPVHIRTPEARAADFERIYRELHD